MFFSDVFLEHLLFFGNLCQNPQRLQETNDAPAFDSLDAGPGGAEGIFLAAGASGSPGQFSRLRILRKGKPMLGATTYCYYLLGRLNFRYLGELVQLDIIS